MGKTFWDAARIETLERMWEQGETSNAIATAVGAKSAKSVEAKANDLAIEARGTPGTRVTGSIKMPYLRFLDPERILRCEFQ